MGVTVQGPSAVRVGLGGPVGTATLSEVEAAQAAAEAASIPLAQKGAASGVATLTSGSKLLESELPSSVVNSSAETFNVKTYGALGNNTGNDGPAIKAADEAAAAAGGGVVWFPPGTYRSTEMLKPSSGNIWQGAGTPSYINLVDPGTEESISVYLHEVSNVKVRNLKIEQANAAARTGVYGLIRVEGCTQVELQGNYLGKSTATGIWAGRGNTDLKIWANTVVGTEADGIHVNRESSQVRVWGNYLNNTGDDAISIVLFAYNSGNGTEEVEPRRSNCENVAVIGNVIQGGKAGGITVWGGTGIVVSSNVINGVEKSGIVVTANTDAGGHPKTHFTVGAQITGNSVRNVTNHGISVANARDITIDANRVYKPGKSGIFIQPTAVDVTVTGNRILRPTERGILAEQVKSTEARLLEEMFTNLGETAPEAVGIQGLTITANGIRHTGEEAVRILGESGAHITGVTITGNRANTGVTATWAQFFLKYVDGVTLTGNNAASGNFRGFQLESCTGVTIAGNEATGQLNSELLTVSCTGILGAGNSFPMPTEGVTVLPTGGNDVTAIQAAVNTYAAVYLQPGAEYKLEGETGLLVDPSKCKVRGSGTKINAASMTGESVAVTFKGTTNAYNNAAHGGWEGIELIGPGKESTVTGIAFAGTATSASSGLFSYRDSSIHDFLIGISERSFEFNVNAYGLSVFNCGTCIDNSQLTQNAGERMTYKGCTFFNSTRGLNLHAEGEHHFTDCSFDFCPELGALAGPHKVFIHGGHVEYTASTTIPLQLSGTRPFFSMQDANWYVHTATTLSAELASGVAVTAIPVTKVEVPIVEGDSIVLTSGFGITDTFTASAAVASGATSIPVTSHAPTHTYPANTTSVIDSTQLPTAIVSNSATIERNYGSYFARVPMSGVITSTGSFVESGLTSERCWMLPNLADGTCITPTNGAAITMPACLPAKTSVMGPLYQNARKNVVSSSAGLAINVDTCAMNILEVTTGSAFSLTTTGNGPPAVQTQELTIVVYNNSGGALGTITWPASFTFAGLTWTNPATGKRRLARFCYDPNFSKWTALAVSPADY